MNENDQQRMTSIQRIMAGFGAGPNNAVFSLGGPPPSIPVVLDWPWADMLARRVRGIIGLARFAGGVTLSTVQGELFELNDVTGAWTIPPQALVLTLDDLRGGWPRLAGKVDEAVGNVVVERMMQQMDWLRRLGEAGDQDDEMKARRAAARTALEKSKGGTPSDEEIEIVACLKAIRDYFGLQPVVGVRSDLEEIPGGKYVLTFWVDWSVSLEGKDDDDD